MPSIKNWGLLALNMAFVICGFLLLRSDLDVAMVTIVFFGSCAILPGIAILREWRSGRPAPDRVELVGGVPIKPSRALLAIIGAWLVALGMVMIFFGGSYGMVFHCVALSFPAVGCYILIGLAAGWPPSHYLQFDPSGIIFGHRGYSYQVQWDNIAGLAAAEMNANPVLLLLLHQPEGIEVTPSESRMRALKYFARCELLHGAHIILAPVQYRMDPSLLMQALDRYIREPSARTELSRKLLGTAAT